MSRVVAQQLAARLHRDRQTVPRLRLALVHAVPMMRTIPDTFECPHSHQRVTRVDTTSSLIALLVPSPARRTRALERLLSIRPSVPRAVRRVHALRSPVHSIRRDSWPTLVSVMCDPSGGPSTSARATARSLGLRDPDRSTWTSDLDHHSHGNNAPFLSRSPRMSQGAVDRLLDPLPPATRTGPGPSRLEPSGLSDGSRA